MGQISCGCNPFDEKSGEKGNLLPKEKEYKKLKKGTTMNTEPMDKNDNEYSSTTPKFENSLGTTDPWGESEDEHDDYEETEEERDMNQEISQLRSMLSGQPSKSMDST